MAWKTIEEQKATQDRLNQESIQRMNETVDRLKRSIETNEKIGRFLAFLKSHPRKK